MRRSRSDWRRGQCYSRSRERCRVILHCAPKPHWSCWSEAVLLRAAKSSYWSVGGTLPGAVKPLGDIARWVECTECAARRHVPKDDTFGAGVVIRGRVAACGMIVAGATVIYARLAVDQLRDLLRRYAIFRSLATHSLSFFNQFRHANTPRWDHSRPFLKIATDRDSLSHRHHLSRNRRSCHQPVEVRVFRDRFACQAWLRQPFFIYSLQSGLSHHFIESA